MNAYSEDLRKKIVEAQVAETKAGIAEEVVEAEIAREAEPQEVGG